MEKAYKRPRNKIRIIPDRELRFYNTSDKGVEISISTDGHHWSCFSLTEREALRLSKKINNYLKRKQQ